MKNTVILLVLLELSLSHADCSPFAKIDDALKAQVFSFCDEGSATIAFATCKHFQQIGSRDSKYGGFIRESAKFSVRTQAGANLFLGEFLNEQGHELADIKDLALLAKDRYLDFIKLVDHASPATYEALNAKVKSLATNNTLGKKHLRLLAASKSPRTRLSMLIGLVLHWKAFMVHTKHSVGEAILFHHNDMELLESTWEQMNTIIGRRVADDLITLLSSEIEGITDENPLGFNLWLIYTESLDLDNFLAGVLGPVIADPNIHEKIKETVDFLFGVYQLSMVSDQHLTSLNQLVIAIEPILDEKKISNQKAAALLKKIYSDVNTEEGMLFVQAQIAIIKQLCY